MARAANSFPVPVSPDNETVIFDFAAFSINSKIPLID